MKNKNEFQLAVYEDHGHVVFDFGDITLKFNAEQAKALAKMLIESVEVIRVQEYSPGGLH